ncbi:MAG: hypothetical protein JXA89_11745, partial [Anaerolineae bacterium]|nr:hypothetical protein [Anaerolineae bacterium]
DTIVDVLASKKCDIEFAAHVCYLLFEMQAHYNPVSFPCQAKFLKFETNCALARPIKHNA